MGSVERAEYIFKNGSGNSRAFRKNGSFADRTRFADDIGSPMVDQYLDEISKWPKLLPEVQRNKAFVVVNGRFALMAILKAQNQGLIPEHLQEEITRVVNSPKASLLKEKFTDKKVTKLRTRHPEISLNEVAEAYESAVIDSLNEADGNMSKVKSRKVKSKIIKNELAKIVQANEEFESLVNHNLRLVVRFARERMMRGIGLLDLIQEGNAGLIKGLQKFDPFRGYKLSTYVCDWIKQAIRRALENLPRAIRVPNHIFQIKGDVMKMTDILTQQLGREPTVSEIYNQFRDKGEAGFSEQNIKAALKADERMSSLDKQVGSDEDDTLGNLQKDPDVDIERSIEASCLREQVWQSLSCLTQRQQKVVVLRFGLVNGKSRTLEEVGNALGVTRERARQIEAEALAKLRKEAGSKLTLC